MTNFQLMSPLQLTKWFVSFIIIAKMSCESPEDIIVFPEPSEYHQYHGSGPSHGDCHQKNSGKTGQCYPESACNQWHPRQSSWSVCSWDIAKKAPRTVCCQRPKLDTKVASMRRLNSLFNELPEKKVRTVQSSTCGRTVATTFPLFKRLRRAPIAGGVNSDALDHPWMATIWFKGSFVCGATIITTRTLLTAAHCVTKFWNTANYEILVGSSSLGSGRAYAISDIVRHARYSSGSAYYDIALVMTSEPIRFGYSVQAVCLPFNNDTFENQLGTVVGFGMYYFDGPLPDDLQEARVPIITNAACNVNYGRGEWSLRRVFDKGIAPSLLCAGYDEGGVDACQGDSGGPLTISVDGVHSILVGIVSFGYKCAERNYPGVYTRVSSFVPWILESMTKFT